MNTIAKYFQLFRLLVFFVFMCSNCSSDTEEPEYPNPNRDNIIGRWKVIETSVRINYSPQDPLDYSKEIIIFDFQENNKLVVTGPVPDVLFVFDHFQEGDHFYKYIKHEVGPNYIPGSNFFIDKPELGSVIGSYICLARLDTDTMTIGTSNPLLVEAVDDAGFFLTGFDMYFYWISFIKMN